MFQVAVVFLFEKHLRKGVNVARFADTGFTNQCDSGSALRKCRFDAVDASRFCQPTKMRAVLLDTERNIVPKLVQLRCKAISPIATNAAKVRPFSPPSFEVAAKPLRNGFDILR